MSAMQRRKGQAAEREAFKILSDELGFTVQRNTAQARKEGGADSLDIDGWAVEVKRQEKLNLSAWWDQAVEQALQEGRKPALMYRASRQPWRVVVSLSDLLPGVFTLTEDEVATISVRSFCKIVRESLLRHGQAG